MLDYESLFDDLAGIGLASWCEALSDLLNERFSSSAHGHFEDWQAILAGLPPGTKSPANLNAHAITIPGAEGVSPIELRQSLMCLKPWRKGPFDVCGVYIDSEWRSDLKWDRIKDAIAPLVNRTVLDVGCGNGYYALRMRGVRARLVIGIDPTLLYVIQFQAISHFMRTEPVHILPLRLHELPGDGGAFDTVFSMGVLYHQRSPEKHLEQLESALRHADRGRAAGVLGV